MNRQQQHAMAHHTCTTSCRWPVCLSPFVIPTSSRQVLAVFHTAPCCLACCVACHLQLLHCLQRVHHLKQEQHGGLESAVVHGGSGRGLKLALGFQCHRQAQVSEPEAARL